MRERRTDLLAETNAAHVTVSGKRLQDCAEVRQRHVKKLCYEERACPTSARTDWRQFPFRDAQSQVHRGKLSAAQMNSTINEIEIHHAE